MKNRTMRVAALLLVLTLMTSCFVGGTFAKYTTAGVSQDQARVAKFGVVITGDSDVFERQYYGVESGWEAKLTVNADTENDLVAPGTSGLLADVTITGTPEVAVRVSNNATFNVENWLVDTTKNSVNDDGYNANTFYCPIVITVVDAAGVTHTIDGTGYTGDEEGFETAVLAAISDAKNEYAPNTNLGTVHEIYVAWNWSITGNDVYDTQLGDRAAANNAGTISISVTTTVEQVD